MLCIVEIFLSSPNTIAIVEHEVLSIILWECFSASELGEFITIKRNMSSAMYHRDNDPSPQTYSKSYSGMVLI